MTKPVVLVNPGQNKPWASIHPPMNLGYIASYLEKHGVEIGIVDELAGQDVREAFKYFRPEIVGITATTPLVPDAYRVARVAHELGITTTVMGGVHASVLPEEALQHVDMVVIGEGERAMLEIVKGNRSRIIKASYIKDLDEIPPPAWHLMNMEFYLSTKERLPWTHLNFIPSRMHIGSVITMRGCPYSCIFCYNSWREAPIRFHSAEWVVSDIQSLIDQYNIQALYFADDDLFLNKKRLIKICQLMREKKIDLIWSCQARSDSIDLETLKMTKEAGCRQIQFGFESGSQRILDLLKNKTITIKQNRQAIELCRQVGISAFATFMVGNPTETIEDIQATFQFIKDSHIAKGGILITTPFPGTMLWKWCQEHNLIPERVDYSKLTMERLVIPACDTISPRNIEQLRNRMQNYLYPLTISEALNKFRGNPRAFLRAIKHPVRTLKSLRRLRIAI